MNNSSVTAIITTYKRDVPILKRAIDSVLNQTHKDIEIIVVNDCPNYENITSINELISTYDKRITYLINERNMGANAARNRGVSESTNNIIAFLDDDDEWLPNKIEESLKYFSEEVGLVYSDLLLVENGKERYLRKKAYNDHNLLPQLLSGNFVGGFSSVVFKKSIFIACNGLDTNLPSYQDLDLWIRMASLCKFQHVKKPLIKYFIMEDSISLNVNKKISGTYSLFSKYDVYYTTYPESRRIRTNNEIIFYIKNGWFKSAFKVYFREYSGNDFLKNSHCILQGLIKYLAFKTISIKKLMGGSYR
ncbi:glycosyltransferase family 2 protein [Rossellomorea marisflavi]|uniref:glycosyltransferase family 2 protein n=1 Tax=Rossellomorea marisflavi TaxID=189381 RepID=UPI00345D6F4E